jgi:hypothetical protein
MGVSGQHYVLATLYSWERVRSTHCIGDWVILRAGLHTEARGNSFACARYRTLVVQSVVRHY